MCFNGNCDITYMFPAIVNTFGDLENQAFLKFQLQFPFSGVSLFN